MSLPVDCPERDGLSELPGIGMEKQTLTRFVCSFGSFVTHGKRITFFWLNLNPSNETLESKNFIYFYLGRVAILLWKTT